MNTWDTNPAAGDLPAKGPSSQPRPPLKIAINCRHGDAQGAAWALYAMLVERFGKENVIFGVVTLQLEWWLEEAMSQRSVPVVLLALIGPQWMSGYAEHQHRGTRDHVASEIDRALRERDRVTVVPVLVNDAVFPGQDALPQALRALAGCQAVRLRPTHMLHDVEHLIARLAEIAANHHPSEPGLRLTAPSVREVTEVTVQHPTPSAAPGEDVPRVPEPGQLDAPDGPQHDHDAGATAAAPAPAPSVPLPPAEAIPPPPGSAGAGSPAPTPPSRPQRFQTGGAGQETRRAETPGSRGRGKRQHTSAGQPDDAVSRAVKAAVKPGLLTFNPPATMVQGRRERVEVGIARSPELREALTTGLRGRGEPQVEGIRTSPYMGVELLGTAFEVTSFSPPEQLVAPIARWEFDVRPYRAGHQSLTLCVSLRIDSPTITGGRIAVPVLERQIQIQVDIVFGARRFLANNWQWLIATILGLGGALAAWLTLLH